jgi:hypothetical protein
LEIELVQGAAVSDHSAKRGTQRYAEEIPMGFVVSASHDHHPIRAQLALVADSVLNVATCDVLAEHART